MPDKSETDIYLEAIPPEYRDLAITLVAVVGAWTIFKNHHNINGLKLRCCEDSSNLFDALDLLRQDSAEAYKAFLVKLRKDAH